MRHGTRGAARAAGLAAAVLALSAPVVVLGELPAFGMVGLASGQTAVLNAVLTNVPTTGHPGCSVTMSFVGATGAVFHYRTGNEVKKQVVLRGNRAEFLSLPAADILGPLELRKRIRAAVKETPGAVSDCCALTMTLELVGPRGLTDEVALPRVPNPPNPLCLQTIP
jgi:hypothetical protein